MNSCFKGIQDKVLLINLGPRNVQGDMEPSYTSSIYRVMELEFFFL
jgi:hypothetical protein